MKMKRLRFLTMIAVFTALFAGCEEPQEGTDTTTGDGNGGLVCLKTLEGHSNSVASVAYSPDGTKIISGSWDDTIKIWGEEEGLIF